MSDGLTDGFAAGRTCAVAGQGQRQMRDWAADHPGLYGAEAFDPALFSTLALAAAFSGPGLSADDLRLANRTCLWCFGLDWLIDYAAKTRAEVDAVTGRCAVVADGGPPVPGDDLTRFLHDVRAELAAQPAFAELGGVWREEFQAVLDSMALEWDWNAARGRGEPGPTFDEYLSNADNLGFTFVLVAHWIARGGGGDVAKVRAASAAVQRVIRLLNDLGTYRRDLKWGDLNGLLLDLSREQVEERLAGLTARAREAIGAMRDGNPELAGYMERQMDFCAGFYGVTDFWGAP
ncbi:terpene synthase family protein [Actinomadura flavalba]|uniref:terpene synthase family protein n=1 Tax=Actinomadura flavalba TaxID=1120938 RepID=UPI00037EE3F6|nr:terpene synthase family protein [Actinomadura flavalba]